MAVRPEQLPATWKVLKDLIGNPPPLPHNQTTNKWRTRANKELLTKYG